MSDPRDDRGNLGEKSCGAFHLDHATTEYSEKMLPGRITRERCAEFPKTYTSPRGAGGRRRKVRIPASRLHESRSLASNFSFIA